MLLLQSILSFVYECVENIVEKGVNAGYNDVFERVRPGINSVFNYNKPN